MATSAVHLTTEEFRQEFLSHPGDFPSLHAGSNPFFALKTANEMEGSDIAELIVAAVNDYGLVPGSKILAHDPYPSSISDKVVREPFAAFFPTRSVSAGGHPLWVDQTVPIHVQPYRRGVDPFDDAEYIDGYGTLIRSRKQAFDRISAVAEVLFAAQQRVFLFMLFIIGRRFRVLRWDRAGVITTPDTDYYEHPHLLCDMLWRIGQLDVDALGFDPSATRIRSGDIDFARMDFAGLKADTDLDYAERRLRESELDVPPVFAYVRTLFRTSLAADWPRFRLQVSDGDRTRSYLVGKPTFLAADVTGRGTRGYVAYDCETGRFVWLKDVWRASCKIAETEGQILRKLNAAGVQRVPTLICEGDVRDQITITADWWQRIHAHSSASPASGPPSPPSSSSAALAGAASPCGGKRKTMADPPDANTTSRHRKRRRREPIASDCPLGQNKHYRIVVQEVCMPLKHFRYGRQLLAVVSDCVVAHHQAETNPETRILHCDISGGNILIYPKIKRDQEGNNPLLIWTGILTDWELAKPVDSQGTASEVIQGDRMGTYPFMSVNLITHMTKPVTVADELESFFHVLVYYAVRNLRSNCTNITSWIDNFFHSYEGPKRMFTCGEKSVTMECTGRLENCSWEGPLLFSSPMDSVFDFFLKSLRAHYKVMAYEAAKAAHRPKTPPPSPPLWLFPDIDIDIDDDDDEYDPEQLAGWKASLTAEPVDEFAPTPEDRDLAETVVDHKYILGRLASALNHSYWKGNDRIPTTKDSEPSSSAMCHCPLVCISLLDVRGSAPAPTLFVLEGSLGIFD
ncbi:hypothetical protein BD311DRAFT_868640 [Dichomitus squalens]|uniref:Fungal-type protein kinase domain-containing protein n=1 Tax=Dichomitus squalens TaxID=114155 RepID=A0A4Q9M958_9APHY|nr:hypothetical protein BD311DRAFT_868640 [Dichomitus squalens]